MRYTNLFGLGILTAALALTGCENKGDPTKSGDKKSSHADDHAHGKGPNGGVVFDLGKYHAEFTVDHDKKQCTVLLLGGDEKTPKAVSADEFILTTKETKTKDGKVVPPMTIKLAPPAGEAKDGKASKFVGTDPGLGNVADFEGTVAGEIAGKPSSGEFKE
ncbi:hypothetical protein GobsT_56610 [Gemmata obscuriglobus]|uniref:Lipoprotein n=1 Tax=Gemmata obscuriglobus TaxID=114 RepID=A0A2Z3GYE6_9BACT|nr:hypothetical protein [Gemmata obscuriglobus]AWM36527.1 hypothetical protein C1280_05485 [Gemmata obscuriglobus]QEG30848.1 hypothetical protein GobsT_56610 [Gemmata obscuriglobus]VTS10179.1 Uncharacterized protein OS=Planctomyces maris DSM 8797 GN=PM8797T_19335 PE=4 SV=1 [Gemmata obscuriglobus UQM 2246]